MNDTKQTSEAPADIWTDEQKQAKGYTMTAFQKRMQDRLAKIRGENTDSDFLRRHKYVNTSTHTA
jgi:hypothetical protein